MGTYPSLLSFRRTPRDALYAAQMSRETELKNEAEKFLLPRDVTVIMMTSSVVHYSRVCGDARLGTVLSNGDERL